LTKIYFSYWIFVTRAWRQLCGTVSDRPAVICFLDENRTCFRSSGQRGCGSELARWIWTAVLSAEVSPSRLYGSIAEIISSLSKHCYSLGRGFPLSFAEICALSYLYDYPFFAHQNSICLSLFYAKFALPMDMTTLISKVTSPAFPIDMTII